MPAPRHCIRVSTDYRVTARCAGCWTPRLRTRFRLARRPHEMPSRLQSFPTTPAKTSTQRCSMAVTVAGPAQTRRPTLNVTSSNTCSQADSVLVRRLATSCHRELRTAAQSDCGSCCSATFHHDGDSRFETSSRRPTQSVSCVRLREWLNPSIQEGPPTASLCSKPRSADRPC